MTAAGRVPRARLRRRRRRGFGGWPTTALKLGLAVLALAYVGLVFSWEQLVAPVPADAPADRPEPATRAPIVQVDFRRARLVGRRGAVAYGVTARTAQRAGAAGRLVALEAPVAELRRADGRWLHVAARRGVFDQRSQVLRLDGAVSGRTSRGSYLAADSLSLDFAARQVRTDTELYGYWRNGRFRAADGARADIGAGTGRLLGDSRLLWSIDENPAQPVPKPPLLAPAGRPPAP